MTIQFLKSTVGRKLLMAVTGFSMIIFVIIHLLGNSSIFAGPDGINAYAAALHRFGLIVWVFRIIMLTLLSLHLFFGIQLTLENRAAKSKSYVVQESLRATFAGKNMIWTGLLIGAFLVYHLLHFTFQVTNPEIAAIRHLDAAGRQDVFMMVVLSFQKSVISSLYVCGMAALGFHLGHGIQSFFQTLGLNNDRSLSLLEKGGTFAALLLFLGYISIPILIFARIVK
ncbi:MAG TPA: succinate dehydrogenase cytochrome b subunit [Thermodesulfovibrionales bacterium]|nr:succinate dehydrogenase cytochrome b subunit [Thermodesulfovibrionales bacterium]